MKPRPTNKAAHRPARRHAPRTTLLCGAAPSEKLLKACALLGLGVRRGPEAKPAPDVAAVDALRTLAPGECALVQGPSGSGKSTLLRALLPHAPGAVVVALRSPGTHARAVIDLVPGDACAALRALSRAGLAEGLLLARRAGTLSEGERWRLSLARGLAACALDPARGVLCADEFASTLDRPTARRLCTLIRRAASSLRIRLLLATAHDDVRPWLKPDVLIVCRADGAATVRRKRGSR